LYSSAAITTKRVFHGWSRFAVRGGLPDFEVDFVVENMPSPRRFPPPWSIEELNHAAFVVKDSK
jgi:hypothetical protein